MGSRQCSHTWSELPAQDLNGEPDLSDGDNHPSSPTVLKQASDPSPPLTNAYPGRPTNYRFKYRAPVEDEHGRWVKTPPPRHTCKAGLRPCPRQREWKDFYLGQAGAQLKENLGLYIVLQQVVVNFQINCCELDR